MTHRKKSFFLVVSAPQGLAEMIALGLLLLYLFHTLQGRVIDQVFLNGALFFCAACGIWPVIRIRFPSPNTCRSLLPLYAQVGYEIAVAGAVSLVMGGIIPRIALGLGWRELWMPSPWGADFTGILLLLTGAGYLACRLVMRLLGYWNALRRHSMLWSLTHAHLLVVIGVSACVSLVYYLLSPFAAAALEVVGMGNGLLPAFITRLTLSLFPTFYIYILTTLAALVIVMPLSAIFSFFFIRRTTNRLHDLTRATVALKGDCHPALVQVDGDDEVAQLQRDFNVMAADLEKTMAALQNERDKVKELLRQRRELTAAVSHELRTPVAIARNRLENALESLGEAPPPSLKKDIEVSNREMVHLQAIMDDLFLLARSDVGALPTSCRPVDIIPLTEQVVDALRPAASRAHRVELIVEADQVEILALVDAERLRQILVNLLRNGIQHSLPGGVIALFLKKVGDTVHIDIHDTGVGILPEDLPHIFERFYQGDGERFLSAEPGEDSDHAGLGLALVKELTEAMGGVVGVTSQPGKGSCFSLCFPAVALE